MLYVAFAITFVTFVTSTFPFAGTIIDYCSTSRCGILTNQFLSSSASERLRFRIDNESKSKQNEQSKTPHVERIRML
jgi:hypothetical protein